MTPSTPLQRRRTWLLSLAMMLAVLLAALPARVSAAAQDPVLEWIKVTNDQIILAGTTPLVSARQTALVASAIFDAVNGIERRFESIHVKAKGPHHASQRAAAIQAAYGILIKLYTTPPTPPAQVAALTARRDASIAALSSGPGAERADAIKAGVVWGQAVADDIFAWRATDGFNPPPPAFLGSLGRPVAGVWRPSARTDAAPGTPGAPGAGPQFVAMTPWVIQRPSQFRPAAPYSATPTGPTDFTSAAYLADYEETKTMGAYAGSKRTADQSELALFWAGNTALFWNRIAIQVSTARHLTFAENVHLFALLNLAMGDAAIICWDGKYRYVLWRPVTAIREGSLDPDPAWRPWIENFPATSPAGVTPAHPEFPSGHSTLSGAAAAILGGALGDNTPFTIDSDVRPGTTRAFPSFSAALEEIHDARVFAGIHWRTACRVGSAIGAALADYVSSHALRERDGHDDDDRR